MNQNFDDFKKAVTDFSNWLDSIPPYEYSLLATITAYLIAPMLSLNAQNALGNWLEQVGQIILTISAQASATPSSEEYNELLDRVSRLEKEIIKYKNKLK